jgi:hypothetical protein
MNIKNIDDAVRLKDSLEIADARAESLVDVKVLKVVFVLSDGEFVIDEERDCEELVKKAAHLLWDKSACIVDSLGDLGIECMDWPEEPPRWWQRKLKRH